MKTRKGYISMLLAICLVGGVITIPVTNASADSGSQSIMSGVSGIGSTQVDSIYFGTYEQSSDGTVLGYVDEPIKWRALSKEDGKLLLISDKILDMKPYYTSEVDITWENSTLRSWMNGLTEGSFYADAFNMLEREAIAETKIVNADNVEYEIDGGNDTNDKVFALSIEEANQYFSDNANRIATNTAYAARRGDGVSPAGEADWYYLRSPGCVASYAAHVTKRGVVDEVGHSLSSYTTGARPAFNMNLDSVLFTSAANGGKAVSGMDGALTEIGSDYSGVEWKVTILDDSRNEFVASALTASDTTWTVKYDGATTGENEYLSVMIVDESGNYTHYGRIKNVLEESGTVDIDVSEINMTGKSLYVFNEQYNGGISDDTKLTDYASQFIEIVPLTNITWRDFQKDDKTTADQAFVKDAFADNSYIANLKSEICDSTGASIDKFNRTYFEANIIYTDCGDCIFYGGTDSDTGLQIGVTESGALLVEPLGLVLEPEVSSFLNNEITLGITTEYGDYDADGTADDTQFGFFINGKLYNNQYYRAIDKQLADNSVTIKVENKAILIRSVTDTKVIIHNLTDGNYTNISSFSNAYKIGEQLVSNINASGLDTPGDMRVCDVNGMQIGQLILYKEKDTHPDSMVDVRDLVAMKKVQSGVALSTWSGTMATYITDFDATVIIDSILNSMQ